MVEENQHEHEGGRGLDILQCCNPGTEVDCWSALGTFFQRHNNEELAVASEKPPKETNNTKGGDSSRIAETSASKTESAPMIPTPPSLALEEKEKLYQIFDILTQHQHKSKHIKVDGPSQNGLILEDVGIDEKKDTTGPFPEFCASIFLLDVAKAAAKVALKDAEREIESENNREHIDFNFTDNPEAAIKRLLQVAKQKEVIQQRHQQHLERVEFLLSNDNNNLLDVLEPYRKSFAECLTKEEPKKEERYQEILPLLNALLGKSEARDTLRFLWKFLLDDDASPDQNQDESKIYSIICLCFHCAVAHSFLTSRDAKHREEAKLSLVEGSTCTITKGETQQESPGSAIQHLIKSLSEYHDKHKTEGNITNKNNHGILPSQALFLEWHDSQVPSLVFSLSIFVQELLFPSFGDDLREISLFPVLHNDKASKNLVFSNTNGESSWLYPISCTIPLNHHMKVRSAVRMLLVFYVNLRRIQCY